MCGSTCFGRLPSHHQEHTTAVGASGITFGGKRLQALPSNGKIRGSWCSCMLPIMGGKTPETCWATSNKRQVINLWKYYILLVELFALPSNGKTRGSWCSCMLLIMGGETPETCWATHKLQVISLRKCCLLLVELFALSFNGKTRGSWCSIMLLIMGGETPETCWATHKCQVISLWKCCILLVELFALPSNGKTRGSCCSCMHLIMGGETPETCWAAHKRQVINLWKYCILLVELFESHSYLLCTKGKLFTQNFCRMNTIFFFHIIRHKTMRHNKILFCSVISQNSIGYDI